MGVLSRVRQSELFSITILVKYKNRGLGFIGEPEGEGGEVLPNYSPPHKVKLKKKKTLDFVDTETSNILRDSRFNLNHPLKSAD